MRKISVVIPCYNEEANIEDSYNLLKKIFVESLPNYDYEIIFADNDSNDNSQNILREIAAKDYRVKAIFNNRNFGPECSTINAMFNSSGDAVVLVMCDRQDPYEFIPKFVKKWEEGEKVVWGQKAASKEFFAMYLIRGLYYKIIKELSNVKQYKQVIGYGIYDKSVIDEMKLLNDPNPILRNVIPNLGYKPYLIKYKQRIREKGKTSYNFFSYFDTAMNSLIHTSKIPMKVMIYSGFLIAFFSFFIGLTYLVYKLTHWDSFSAGITPIILLLTFFAAVQVFFLGVVGEYLLAVLDRVSFAKHVVEKEKINF